MLNNFECTRALWITMAKRNGFTEIYKFLGVIKSVKNPTEIEMANMEAELEQLWHRLKGQKTSIEKHPANPSPVRGFSEGGVPTTSPKEEKRCDRCDWNSFCSGGQGLEYVEPNGFYQLPGKTTETNTVPFDQLNVRFNLTNIDSINYREMTLQKLK